MARSSIEDLDFKLRMLLTLSQYEKSNINRLISMDNLYCCKSIAFYKYYNHMYNDRGRSSSLYNLTLVCSQKQEAAIFSESCYKECKENFNREVTIMRSYLRDILMVVSYEEVNDNLKHLEKSIHESLETLLKNRRQFIRDLNMLTRIFNIDISSIIGG